MNGLSDPQAWSLERLGHLLVSTGRSDDARAVFEGITRIAPQRSYAWYALAKLVSLQHHGDSRAIDYADHACQLDPSARNLLLCAELHLKAGNQEKAASAFSRLVRLPDSPERRRALALRNRWFDE